MNTRHWLVPAILAVVLSVPTNGQAPAKLPAKLERLILPKVEFKMATAAESVDWLQRKIKELDPDKTGVSIKLTGPVDEFRINMKMEKVSAADLIGRLARHFDREILVHGESIELKSTLTAPRFFVTSDESIKLTARADKIVIPRLVFRECKAAEVVAFIEKKTKELDPEKIGVPIKLTGPVDQVTEVTLNLQDIPLPALIQAVAKLFDREIQVKGETIELKSKFTEPRVQSSAPPIPGLESVPK